MKTLAILSVSLLAGSAALFGDTISISPASQTVLVSQTVTVDVDVDQIPDLYAFQFDLSFDPAVLAATSISEGSLFPPSGSYFSPGSIDNTAGSISLTYGGGFSSGVAGPGTLAVVQFTAIGTGTSSIGFSCPNPATGVDQCLGDLQLEDSSLNVLNVDAVSGDVDVAALAVPEANTSAITALGLLFILAEFFRRGLTRSGEQAFGPAQPVFEPSYSAGYNPAADLNNDDVINIKDLAIIAHNVPQGTVCR